MFQVFGILSYPADIFKEFMGDHTRRLRKSLICAGFGEGPDFSRVVRSLKMFRASAPGGVLLAPSESFSAAS